MDDGMASRTEGSGGSTAPAEEIKDAAHSAGAAVSAAVADAKARVTDQGAEKVDGATTSAGSSLKAVADQLRQASDNLGEDQGWARQTFSQGAEGLDRVSAYLREGRLEDFTRDLERFARSNPAAFLAGSVALGFIAARVVKTAASHATSSQVEGPQEPPAPTTGTPLPQATSSDNAESEQEIV